MLWVQDHRAGEFSRAEKIGKFWLISNFIIKFWWILADKENLLLISEYWRLHWTRFSKARPKLEFDSMPVIRIQVDWEIIHDDQEEDNVVIRSLWQWRAAAAGF